MIFSSMKRKSRISPGWALVVFGVKTRAGATLDPMSIRIRSQDAVAVIIRIPKMSRILGE
jgi:hypothetical protein